MRVSVTTFDIDPNELAALKSVLGIADIQYSLNRIEEHHQTGREENMANFDALNAKIDETNQAVSDAADRVSEDVQSLRDVINNLELDSDDQAKVDAAVTKLDGTVSQLQAIDPVPPVTDEPTDPDAPVNP